MVALLPVVALVGSAMLGTGGCSSAGSQRGSGPASAAPQQSTSSTFPWPAGSPRATTPATPSNTPTGSGSNTTLDPASVAACMQTAAAYNESFEVLSRLVGGGGPADFADLRRRFDDLEPGLPPELVEPFRVVHEAVIGFATTAAALDLTTTAGLDAMSRASSGLEAPPVVAAGTVIDDWFTGHCP